MSVKYINQPDGNSKTEHFQADGLDQNLVDVSHSGSNPIIIDEPIRDSFTTDFDMSSESLW